MVHFVFLVVLIIGGLNAYIYFYDKKAQKEELERDLERLERIRQEIESENTKVDVEFEHETRDLVLETLMEMGCEYGEGTEENDIRIRLQGLSGHRCRRRSTVSTLTSIVRCYIP